MLMVAVTTTAATAKEKGGQVFHAVVAQDGTGDYLTVQAAIDAAPVGRTEPWRIYIKEGTYKEHVDIPESKPYLSLIGEGRHKTQISCDRLCGGPTGVKVDEGATVTARSSNLFFEGINFVNSYRHQQKICPVTGGISAGQRWPAATTLFTQADRVVLSRCPLLSFQDTWLTPFRLPNLRWLRR